MSSGPETDPRPTPGRDVIPTGPPPEPAPPLLDTERVTRAPERAPRRAGVRMAWAVALVADAIQWVLWPLFAAGAASPFDDAVDLVVAVILVRLLGWHWAFLPAFLAEVIPGVNLVPTWTAAVFLATRRHAGSVKSNP